VRLPRPEFRVVMRDALHWWDGELWWRTYHQGGFDGWRTLSNHRLACATMETALRCPEMREEIRGIARYPWSHGLQFRVTEMLRRIRT
jgi:hypothetical protein